MQRFSIAMTVVGVLWTDGRRAGGGGYSVSPHHVDRHAERPCSLQRAGGRGHPDPLRRRQQRVRHRETAVRCRAWTNMRLSQLNVTPVQLNAVFFTHMHSDHTEGFADIM